MADATRPADGVSLREALRAHHAGALGWALVCCGRDRDAASEALQSAYARILEGSARYDARASFRTWLFGVVRLTSLEHRSRSARRAARHAPLAVEPADERALPEEAAMAAHRVRALADALGELEGRQAELVHLVFYEGLTLDEAAAALDIHPGTARTHYDRGKKRLLELLAERGVTR